MQVDQIWIENEVTQAYTGGVHDPLDTNSDVLVTMTDGSRWGATFFSYANIATLAANNQASGECIGGHYFWARDMILVDEVSRQRIAAVIDHLLVTGEFEQVFARYNNAVGLHDEAG